MLLLKKILTNLYLFDILHILFNKKERSPMTQNNTQTPKQNINPNIENEESYLRTNIKTLGLKDDKYSKQYKRRIGFSVTMLMSSLALFGAAELTNEPIPTSSKELRKPEVIEKIEKNTARQALLASGGIITSFLGLGSVLAAISPARKQTQIAKHKKYYQKRLRDQRTI